MKLIIFLSIFPSIINAYEVDNFTDRDLMRLMRPADEFINKKVNDSIKKRVDEYNLKNTCDKNVVKDQKSMGDSDIKDLYLKIKNDINGNPVGEIEKQLDGGENENLAPQKSIYDKQVKMNAFEKIIHFFTSLTKQRVLALAGVEPSIMVSGHLIGVDKMGHFAGQGFEYFEKIHSSNGSLKDALDYGIGLEEGIYGLSSTGVKSYGDLSANFQGLNFWENLMLAEHPYIECEGGKLKQVKQFEIEKYTTDAMDEAINCSDFSNYNQNQVNENFNILETSCPAEVDKCEALVKMPCAEYIISPKCLDRPELKEKINRSCYSSVSSLKNNPPKITAAAAIPTCPNVEIQSSDIKPVEDLHTDVSKTIQTINDDEINEIVKTIISNESSSIITMSNVFNYLLSKAESSNPVTFQRVESAYIIEKLHQGEFKDMSKKELKEKLSDHAWIFSNIEKIKKQFKTDDTGKHSIEKDLQLTQQVLFSFADFSSFAKFKDGKNLGSFFKDLKEDPKSSEVEKLLKEGYSPWAISDGIFSSKYLDLINKLNDNQKDFDFTKVTKALEESGICINEECREIAFNGQRIISSNQVAIASAELSKEQKTKAEQFDKLREELIKRKRENDQQR